MAGLPPDSSHRSSPVGELDLDEVEDRRDLGVMDSQPPTGTMDSQLPKGTMDGRDLEMEQELSKAKRENFNLKLQIHYLEEMMGKNFIFDKDHIEKENHTLMVEIKNLRRKVNKKCDLLRQAQQALILEKDEHRQFTVKKEVEMSQLQQDIDTLKAEMRENVLMADSVQSLGTYYVEPLELSGIQSLGSGYNKPLESGCSSRRSDSVQILFKFEGSQWSLSSEEGLVSTEPRDDVDLEKFMRENTRKVHERLQNIESEYRSKHRKIDDLQRELASVNERLSDRAQEIRDCKEKLSEQYLANNNLLSQILEEKENAEDLKSQLDAAIETLTTRKFYTEDERAELKSLETANTELEKRISTLENEKHALEEVIIELRAKLEAAAADAKKMEDLVIRKQQQMVELRKENYFTYK